MSDAIDLAAKLAQIREHWNPKIVGEVNGEEIRLAKLLGEFDWHAHPDSDELFLVLEGELLLRLRDREVRLRAGQFFVVPRGVEHLPVAAGECHVLLIEAAGTRNTGELRNERTLDDLERI